MSAVVSLISDPAGEPRGVVLVLRDLSRVRDLEEQVRRADRLAGLGVLAAGVAPEVRNPLMALRRRRSSWKKTRAPSGLQVTAMIIRQVDRLNRIVDDLLAFAGARQLRCESCNVNQILEEALRLEETMLQTGRIAVVRQYDPEVPVVAGDPDRLLQVLLNLVRNGAEAMPGNGRGVDCPHPL